MARISSAAFVTALLQFLQAYNRAELDAALAQLDPDVEWHGARSHRGRQEVCAMLETLRERWSKPRARPDDFRESAGRVLMVVCFHEGDPAAPRSELRQSWIADMTGDGRIRRLVSYASAGEAARAFDAIARQVHA